MVLALQGRVAELFLAAPFFRLALFLFLVLEGMSLLFFRTELAVWARGYSHQLGWALGPLLTGIPVLGVLFIAAPIRYFLPSLFRVPLAVVVYSLSFFLIARNGAGAGQWKIVVLCYLAPLVVPPVALLAFRNSSSRSKVCVLIGAVVGVIAVWVWALLYFYAGENIGLSGSTAPFRFIGPKISHGLMLYSLFTLLLGIRAGLSSTSSILKFLFQPGHFFGPFPVVPLKEEGKEDIKVVVAGLYDLHLAASFLVVLYWISRWCDSILAEMPMGWAGWGLAGVERYLQYYFGSCVILYCASGSLRLMGLAIHDPEDWPLFAASPVDRWRRWTVYQYQWLIAFVFLPIQRRVGGVFLPILGSFLFSFVSHVDFDLLYFFLYLAGKLPVLPIEISVVLKSKLLFFSLHGLAVYLFLKIPSLAMNEEKRSGWMGVVGVFLLMSLIHLTTVFRASDFSMYFLGF